MLSGLRHRREAFTLAEVLVAVALVAILAAVITPTIRGRLQDGYEDALVQELDDLKSAVTMYRQDVGKYPPNLDYLTALRGSPKDKCNVALTATAKANWRGPYVTRNIGVTAGIGGYIVAGKDTILDTLITYAGPNGLAIRIAGPDTLTAHNLDLKIDGVNNKSAGSLQWTAPSASAQIDYVLPTRANTC